jgi:hypothetical protein
MFRVNGGGEGKGLLEQISGLIAFWNLRDVAQIHLHNQSQSHRESLGLLLITGSAKQESSSLATHPSLSRPPDMCAYFVS